MARRIPLNRDTDRGFSPATASSVKAQNGVAEVRNVASGLGALIGRGKATDVYALDADRVLRRYRAPRSCAVEADLMTYLRQAGYPVPAVLAVDGGNLVMERLYGQDMAADLASRPWRIMAHTRTLTQLQNQLHQIAAPPGLPQPLGPGGRILHLDLHPGNVMLTSKGPVVIDWTNGSAGPAGADVAMAYLIMASSDADGLPSWLGPVVPGLRRIFLRRFLAAVWDDPRPYMTQVAQYRLKDANLRPAESARLLRLTRQACRSPVWLGQPDEQA